MRDNAIHHNKTQNNLITISKAIQSNSQYNEATMQYKIMQYFQKVTTWLIHFISVFKTRNVCQGFLTSVVKNSLRKPHAERDKMDFERISALLTRTNAFSRYPHDIRKQLPRIVNYERFEHGTKVLQEGKEALSVNWVQGLTVSNGAFEH